MYRFFTAAAAGLVVACGLVSTASAQVTFEPEFSGYSFRQLTSFFPHWGIVDIDVLPNGLFVACLKPGVLWLVDPATGTLPPDFLLLDMRDRVNERGDSGLMTVLVDPDFDNHPYIYVSYAVETNFANPDTTLFKYMRVSRFRLNPATNYRSLDPAFQEEILIGTDWADGILQEAFFHTSGDKKWGTDGTLLLTTGDSHNPDLSFQPTNTELYGPGRFDSSLDIGALRAQTLNNLNGKVLRVDRHTGDGLPSNPFWNGLPRSAESRIWAYGLREPWRMSIRQGTGSFDPADGRPGIMFVGDVGKDDVEEINVTSPSGGNNFGWPFWEGTLPVAGYDSPSYGGPVPWIPFEDTTAPSATMNPVGGSHPTLPPSGIFDVVTANSITPGVFYDWATFNGNPSRYGPELDGAYLFADWGGRGIYLATIDGNQQFTSVSVMADNSVLGTAGGGEGIVDFFLNPQDGFIYVSTYWRLYRLEYDPSGAPPSVALAADRVSGPLDLSVNFDASATTSPSGTPISAYRWFVDDVLQETTTIPSWSYVFTENRNYNVRLEAEDTTNKSASRSMTIYAGNNPPTATIIEPTPATTYPNDGSRVMINMVGQGIDPDGGTVTHSWRVLVATKEGTTFHSLGTLPGDTNSISIGTFDQPAFHRFEYTVTDERGQSTVAIVDIFEEGQGPSNLSDWLFY